MNDTNIGPKWGFLRETKDKAIGVDEDTGVHRNGLDEYLAVIFNGEEIIHNKAVPGLIENGNKSLKRPDYRIGKLLIEFDGIQHYTDPEKIRSDEYNTQLYQNAGYSVVRIPYFIQLSNKAVKTLFEKDIDEFLFDESIPSLGIKGKNTPAYLCTLGLMRMAKEFKKFPGQYEVNIAALKKQNDPILTGVQYLEEAYNSI